MIRKFTLALLAVICAVVTVNAQSSRLVGMHRTYFFTSWNPYDSATFVYSNGRGGEGANFESRTLKHDTAFFVGWNGSNWQPYYNEIQSFDNDGNIAERVKIEWNSGNNTYENNQKYTFSYDANHNMTEEIWANWNGGTNNWDNQGRILRTYDGNSNMLTYTYQTWTNNSWQNSNSNVSGYTSNNDILYNKQMTWNSGTSQWDSTSYWQYYYTNNLQDSILIYTWNNGWQTSSRFHMGYDMNNNPNFMLYQSWDGSNWVNLSQRFTTYATQYSEDSSQTWNTSTNSWVNESFYSFDLSSTNKTLRYLLKYWDTTNGAWVNDLVDSTTYNSFDQKASYKRLSWIDSTQSWGGGYYDNTIQYYYEPYTSDVKSVSSNPADIQLYPVPAGNTLHVSAQFEIAEDFKIAIYDMQGRIIRQWGEKGAKSFNRSLPIADLSAGNYILQVRSKNGQSQEQFTIVK